MKLNKLVILSLALFALQTSRAQDQLDLGLKVEKGQENQLILELRKPVAYKTRLNFGLTMATDHSLGGNIFLGANDTILSERHYYWNKSGTDLRIGVERQLRWPIFSVSGDVMLGYRLQSYSRFSSHTGLNGNSYLLTELENFGYSPDYAAMDQHRFQPGLRAAFNMDLPINKKLTLTTNISHTLSTAFVLATNIIQDPLGEYALLSGPQQFNSYSLDFETRFTIGLRYKLGKEKTFEKKEKSKKD